MAGRKLAGLVMALKMAGRGMDLEKAWVKCGKPRSLKNAMRAYRVCA
tara:strand:- start:47 stop:187 length:141 start_codon:yes stop_codon:yes gene_type:complete